MARSESVRIANLNPSLAPPLSQRQQRLLQLLRKATRELSGQELHQQLSAAQESHGLATVYRGLKHLQRVGLVRCRKLATGESLYAPVERDAHHFTCVVCGRSERLPICPLHGTGLGLATVLLQGFMPLFHTVEIHGLCVRCQPKQVPGDG